MLLQLDVSSGHAVESLSRTHASYIVVLSHFPVHRTDQTTCKIQTKNNLILLPPPFLNVLCLLASPEPPYLTSTTGCSSEILLVSQTFSFVLCPIGCNQGFLQDHDL